MQSCASLVVHGGRGAGQVVDLVHLQHQALRDVVADQLKVGLADQLRNVVLAAGEKVVHADDL
jgi:hypothetical protein